MQQFSGKKYKGSRFKSGPLKSDLYDKIEKKRDTPPDMVLTSFVPISGCNDC